ncbi:hypothetical protein HGRIS_011497 [Hohenbuehelia grisea]|uniref:DUF1793-domain-containing protein n=1 Tax=Hohenbuehelia grisea TaxID=104357 RepID=A0ABR3JXI6_9AGAR
MISLLVVIVLSFLSNFAVAQTPQTFWPSGVPLLVKSPYLNAWLPTRNNSNPLPPGVWPNFWTGSRILGWAGFVRVDGANYFWLGQTGPGNATVLTNTVITPTRSIFTVQAGPLELNITFFSPIEPGDLALQSFPFAYYYIDLASTDGQSHSVQLYSDISGEWASNNDASLLQWNTISNAVAVYHQFSRSASQSMQEVNNIAEDGTMYIGMAMRPGLTWQTGTDVDLRNLFNATGTLQNQQDVRFRPISKDGKDWPVFAIAVDLGTVQTISQPVVWTIGLVRDPSVTVNEGGNMTQRSSLYWTRWPKIDDGISNFLQDFPQAQQRANNLDSKIMNQALATPNTADLVSLGLRQVMAASEITVSKMSNGTFNMSDIGIFTKDVGFSRRTNPVEVAYASLPAILYLNYSIAKFVLKPILEFHSRHLSSVSFAMSDLGSSFPVSVPVISPSEIRGVEDTGSMLIMVLAHAMYSGDGSLIAQHYPLLKKWADYLVGNVFGPAGQRTSDASGVSTGQDAVNLAIKGIIGVKAMSKISEAFNQSQDAEQYNNHTTDLFTQWRAQAFQGGHLVSSFKDPSLGGVIYNLYADKLLRLNLVDDSVYQGQAAFYQDLVAKSSGKAGIPLVTGGETGRVDWSMLAAASVNNTITRNSMITLVHDHAGNNSTQGGLGFASTFVVETGRTTGPASASLGSMFSILALDLPSQNIIIPPPASEAPNEQIASSHRGLSKGSIAGIVIGLLILLAFVVAGFLFWRRRRLTRESPGALENATFEPFSLTGPENVGRVPVFSGDSRMLTPVHPPTSTVFSSFPPSSSGDETSRRETEMLRTDVQELRREMERMRLAVEPPPEY